MSLCHHIKRRWRNFKDLVYGRNDTAYEEKESGRFRAKKVRFATDTTETGSIFHEHTSFSEKRLNYCLPRHYKTYEAYGIVFETRHERDAFEIKMERMEKIFEKELYDIRCQHARLRKEKLQVHRLTLNNNSAGTKPILRKSVCSDSSKTSVASLINEDEFLSTDDDPFIEEIILVNELQDVYEHMCNLGNELKHIEKILKVEIHERELHPEPTLVHVKGGRDELWEQIKNDGGFRYCSSDNTEQHITYENLPPPLSLTSLLDSDDEEAT